MPFAAQAQETQNQVPSSDITQTVQQDNVSDAQSTMFDDQGVRVVFSGIGPPDIHDDMVLL